MNSYCNSTIRVKKDNSWIIIYPKTTIESINTNNGRPLQDILDHKLNLENINKIQFSLENDVLSIKKLPNSFKVSLYDDIYDMRKQWSFDASSSTELILDNGVFAYKTDDTYGEMLSIPLATNRNNGLMSSAQVKSLEDVAVKVDALSKYFGEDSDTIINKVEEIIKIFEDYSEGFDLYEALAEIEAKVDNKIEIGSLKSITIQLVDIRREEVKARWSYNGDINTGFVFDNNYFTTDSLDTNILRTRKQVYVQETAPSTDIPEGSIWFQVSNVEV